MFSIAEISDGLHLGPDGIWHPEGIELLSYPASGYRDCRSLERDSFWFSHRNTVVAALLHRWPPSGPLFDIGGGTGVVSESLCAKGLEVVLVEPGSEGAAIAKERGISTIVCATLGQARFHDNALPAAGLFDVLEHIEHDDELLQAIHRLLQPSGRVYLTAPAHNWLWSNEDDHAGHYRRYCLTDLKRKLSHGSFEVEYAGYFFAALPLPIFLMRTIPARLGLRKKFSLSQAQKEHSRQTGWGKSILNQILTAEASYITRGRRLSFGASCVAVGRKH